MERPMRNAMFGWMGGIAATAAMDGYWAVMARMRSKRGGSSEEPATVQVARRGLRRMGVKSPSRRTRAIGGQIVHWSYGTDWGLATGISHGLGFPLDWGYGLPLGAALWAAGDLYGTYKLGVAKHPREYPTHAHALALGAHLVYGVTLWATIAGLKKLEGKPRRGFFSRAA